MTTPSRRTTPPWLAPLVAVVLAVLLLLVLTGDLPLARPIGRLTLWLS